MDWSKYKPWIIGAALALIAFVVLALWQGWGGQLFTSQIMFLTLFLLIIGGGLIILRLIGRGN